MARPTKLTAKQVEHAARRIYDGGETVTHLARELKVSRRCLKSWLRRAGHPPLRAGTARQLSPWLALALKDYPAIVVARELRIGVEAVMSARRALSSHAGGYRWDFRRIPVAFPVDQVPLAPKSS